MKNPRLGGLAGRGSLGRQGYAFGVPARYRAYTIATLYVAIGMSIGISAGCARSMPRHDKTLHPVRCQGTIQCR